ncbi:MAG: hypothetical protein C0606_00265 [Hyphomicrobiales bacterium]|nr:MAG: hypothetical protein C0606_00265 [Hyphomicrobiales bacterium]
MEELISRIVANVGIDEELAKKAVGIILNFLTKEGSEGTVAEMIKAIPGAQELIDAQAGEKKSGGLLGALGSLGGGLGAMGALNQLTDAGLDMDQVKGVTDEVVGMAREKAGPDVVDEVIGSIPGLGQFIS